MTTKGFDQEQEQRFERPLQAHFFIYKNLAYVSERRFIQERISIGSSSEADVILKDQSIADIHALVKFEDGHALLWNRFPNDGLRLNGRSVHLEPLRHEDVIDIGPFSLKIKMSAAENDPDLVSGATYAVRLVNRYDSSEALNRAARNLAKLLRTDVKKILAVIANDQVVIKRNLAGRQATRWQNALLKAGIICDVRVEGPAPGAAPAARSVPAKMPEPHRPGEISSPARAAGLFVDEDEDEDEIWEAAFSLQQKLDTPPRLEKSWQAPPIVQIVKTIGNSVIDVGVLSKGRKYFVDGDDGRFCLVCFHSRKGPSVTISQQMSGFVENSRGQVSADLRSYKTEEYATGRYGQCYQIPLPDSGALVVDEGNCRYRIMLACATPSPEVTAGPRPRSLTWRHWAYSGAVHLFFLLWLSMYLYLQATAPTPQSPYFVKIDPSMIRKLEALNKPKPPVIEPPPKPEPQRVAEKLETPKQKPVAKKTRPIRRVPKPSSKKRMVAARTPVDRHPGAGGGFGKGNIKNRNINQTGILSVLGTTAVGGTGEAIAAVTNLDAVPVPGAGEKNFTVGGLKGSLGNGKISAASGEIVQTKSSHQVLRSAGARGKGDVAALSRGATGTRKVQAMVTAKMSRTVKIEGGMSREMVKRVIDQHLQEITFCYETALMSNPSILGRIVFEWKILMDGSVGEIRIVASSINSHEIHGCIKSAIGSWRFPQPVGTEVIVSYPFVFDLVAY